jgi:hypothetical protein
VLLPKGIEKHKNLSTSFTRFDQLLQDLAENRFSGYIKLNFWGYEGVLVLDTGHIIEAYSSEENVYLIGEQAVLRILKRSGGPDGSIEVHELSSEIALALGYAFQSSQYDEGALSNYSLSQVFDFLEREAITGYVDLQFSNKKGNGTVYYLEGTPVEAVIMSNSGKIVSGEQVFYKFSEIGELVQPLVNVSRIKDPQTIVEEKSFVIPWQHQKYLNFWKEFLQYLSNLVNGSLTSKIIVEQLKKDRFYSNFRKCCRQVSDHYPFLHPEHGDVEVAPDRFKVKKILNHPPFLQGMTMVINRVLKRGSSRRFRKLDIEAVLNDVVNIARRNDVLPTQLDPKKLIFQIFKGFI